MNRALPDIEAATTAERDLATRKRPRSLGVRRSDRARWMASRARNALRRPMLIAGSAASVFIGVLMFLVLAPRREGRVRTVAPAPIIRADTTVLVADVERARQALATAEAALAGSRRAIMLALAPPLDTFPPESRARRDSLNAIAAAINDLIGRVNAAPLAASYRALGESPLIRSEPGVRVALDSLTDIERQREAFGAAGGADPVFVALTSRANALGAGIQRAAEAKLTRIREEAALLTPRRPPPPPSEVLDTLARLDAVGLAHMTLDSAMASLARARVRNAAADRQAERMRDVANVSAPPVAIAGAAAVLALALGFAASLFLEVRRPRIADVREAERIGGARVLAVVRPQPAGPERARRRADMQTPPMIDLSNDAYRLLHLHLAATGSSLPVVTITGAEPAVVATVAGNLAAAAAYEARSTVIIDADLAHGAVAGVLRVRSGRGLAGVIQNGDWTSVTATRVIGRDRTLDVVPSGSAPAQLPEDERVDAVRRELVRVARRYDFAVIVAPLAHAVRVPNVLPAPDVVLCARVGSTTLTELARAVIALRQAGAHVRGTVLWDADAPLVPTREEIAIITAETGAAA